MARITTTRWDTADFLRSEADIQAYLEAVLQENDTALLLHALGVAARARGMTQMARDTGITRESLYRALSGEGNPEFATVMKVMRALGLKLHFKVATKRRKAARKSHSQAKPDPALNPA